MLEASVQRVSELIVTSVAAFIATEPGAYSSSRLPRVCCRQYRAVASGGAQERTNAAGARVRSARAGIASSQTRPTAAAFTPRQDQPPPSMWPRSQRRRRSPSGCSGRLAGAGIPVSHMSLGCMAVRAKALPLRRRISWQCEPWRCHAGAASRHGPRTTPARTHPCSTHLHRNRTHHALTSPPATRRPHPLQRPRPS